MNKHPVAYPAFVLKAIELAPTSTFGFFPQTLADWGLLHKYLTLIFNQVFNQKRCELEVLGGGWRTLHMVAKSSTYLKACLGTLHLGSRPTGLIPWLAANSFLGHQRALVKLSKCHMPSTVPRGCEVSTAAASGRTCDKRAGGCITAGMKGRMGAAGRLGTGCLQLPASVQLGPQPKKPRPQGSVYLWLCWEINHVGFNESKKDLLKLSPNRNLGLEGKGCKCLHSPNRLLSAEVL